jgi:uncharacterized protein YbjQ (UPF0145 family)
MKTADIAKRYQFDVRDFTGWLEASRFESKRSMSGIVQLKNDQDLDQVIAEYSAFVSEREANARAEQDEQERLAQEKSDALASMLITSGFQFDGYTITKYSGYISGDHAVQMDRPSQGFWGSVNGNVGGDLLKGLVHIRRHALAELKEAAYALGCNAVIGVDFDYITLDPETVNNRGGTLYLPFLFAVTANGNAVVIEKH